MTVTALYEVRSAFARKIPIVGRRLPTTRPRPCAGLARAGGCVHATPSSPRVRKGCGQGS